MPEHMRPKKRRRLLADDAIPTISPPIYCSSAEQERAEISSGTKRKSTEDHESERKKV